MTDPSTTLSALSSALESLVANARGSNGLLRFIVPIEGSAEANIVAGRDLALDAELAAQIERIVGEGSVDLSVQEPPKLALVG